MRAPSWTSVRVHLARLLLWLRMLPTHWICRARMLLLLLLLLVCVTAMRTSMAIGGTM